MEPSQENIGRDFPGVESLEKETDLAGAILEEIEFVDFLEGFVLLRGFQSNSGWSVWGALDVGIDDV